MKYDQLKARVDAAVALRDAATPGVRGFRLHCNACGEFDLLANGEWIGALGSHHDAEYFTAHHAHIKIIKDLWALVQSQQVEIERLKNDS